jgi:hypothetical protein
MARDLRHQAGRLGTPRSLVTQNRLTPEDKLRRPNQTGNGTDSTAAEPTLRFRDNELFV